MPSSLPTQTIFHFRAQILREIRHYFEAHDFLEVETPIRIPENAPERYVDPIYSDGWALQTSPELCMKRILANGFPRIFQICKCFRQEERGQYHLPEFTMLEWYERDITRQELMDTTEDLLFTLCQTLTGKPILSYQDHHIDVTPLFERYTIPELFRKYAPLSMEEALEKDLFDEIIGVTIAPQLGFSRPTFVEGYPANQSVLAAPNPANIQLADRFELYIAGMEICNGCTELTHKENQKNRFIKEIKLRETLGKPSQNLPKAFLNTMAHLPPSAGNALGVDRLCMLFTNTTRIEEIVFFPPENL